MCILLLNCGIIPLDLKELNFGILWKNKIGSWGRGHWTNIRESIGEIFLRYFGAGRFCSGRGVGGREGGRSCGCRKQLGVKV